MSKCDCGQDTFRIKGTAHKDGSITWVCPHCQPSEFDDEPFLTPADRKIWRHEEAFPDKYYQRSDGTLVPKDEMNADTLAIISADPDAEEKQKAIEWKRKHRRTRPAEDWEISQAESAWRPFVEDLKKQYEEDEERQAKVAEELIQKYVRPEQV